MQKKVVVWTLTYLGTVAAILLVSYIAVNLYFGIPFSDPILSHLIKITPQSSQSNHITTPAPTPKILWKNDDVIHRFVDGATPAYTVAGFTIGRLIVSNGEILGKLRLLKDPNRTEVPFVLPAYKGIYTLGTYFGAIGRDPNGFEDLTGSEMIRRIPDHTLVQVRVATINLDSQTRSKLINALESAAQDKWDLTGITLPIYDIEVAE